MVIGPGSVTAEALESARAYTDRCGSWNAEIAHQHTSITNKKMTSGKVPTSLAIRKVYGLCFSARRLINTLRKFCFVDYAAAEAAPAVKEHE
jgi:hypothetical protein